MHLRGNEGQAGTGRLRETEVCGVRAVPPLLQTCVSVQPGDVLAHGVFGWIRVSLGCRGFRVVVFGSWGGFFMVIKKKKKKKQRGVL